MPQEDDAVQAQAEVDLHGVGSEGQGGPRRSSRVLAITGRVAARMTDHEKLSVGQFLLAAAAATARSRAGGRRCWRRGRGGIEVGVVGRDESDGQKREEKKIGRGAAHNLSSSFRWVEMALFKFCLCSYHLVLGGSTNLLMRIIAERD